LNPLQFKDYPKFDNVSKNFDQIDIFLKNLSKPGIYIFYLTDKPLCFYIGKSIDLRQRFKNHIRRSKNNNSTHPKFYNAVNKYK
jgi:excinuclease UvrABC nuclease subunit